MIDDLKEKDAQDMAVSVGLLNLDQARAQAGLPKNMYHALKDMCGKEINNAMTAYADAKCISMDFVARQLKDSYCENLFDDVVLHWMNSLGRAAGIQPPYLWSPIVRKWIARDILRRCVQEKTEGFVGESEVFANVK